MIRFLLNDTLVETAQPAGSTVLDFVRYQKRLTGTKTGCREGDCGACTVLVGDFENGQLRYRSATSCLMLLGNAAGKHIVTVEGLNGPQLSPVQQAMVDTNGTQCGFCTLGFVLSFTGFLLDPKARSYEQAVASVDGNICRCTGYKSIERAARIITDDTQGKPEEATIDWLVTQGFVPEYFSGIEQKLRALGQHTSDPSEALFVGGGTDLVVQKPHYVKSSGVTLMASRPELKTITGTQEGTIRIGGSVTVTQLLENDLMNRHFPELGSYLKLVSSTPIRNMATVAGNLVNASPIGDLTIFFLALNATVELRTGDSKRTVLLKDFYKAYKQLDKAPGEWIEAISFLPPSNDTFFNFEKVSKRTWLDIASVNSACQLKCSADGFIEWIHLSAGGVGPVPKYLAQTCAFLAGKQINRETVEAALAVMNDEISPISDARGTAAYKRLLLRQLFAAHLFRFNLVPDFLENLLPA